MVVPAATVVSVAPAVFQAPEPTATRAVRAMAEMADRVDEVAMAVAAPVAPVGLP